MCEACESPGDQYLAELLGNSSAPSVRRESCGSLSEQQLAEILRNRSAPTARHESCASLSDQELAEVLGNSSAPTKRSNTAHFEVTIHGKVYDISNFHDHPGGPDFLKVVAGKDATTHFEMHHLRIEKARARLRCLPELRSDSNSGDGWDWGKDGFYATVRRTAAETLLKEVGHPILAEKCISAAPCEVWRQATTSTSNMRAARILAIVVYVASFAMACVLQSLMLAVLCGVFTAVMGGFGHSALHQRGRTWDCWLFECAAFSHQEYRIHEHTSHHVAPNLPGDPDATFMQPFVEFGPPRKSSAFRRGFSVLAFHVLASLAALMLIWRRLFYPRTRYLFGQLPLVMPLTQLFLLSLSGQLLAAHTAPGVMALVYSLSLWLIIWISASFWFMLVTTVTHNQESNWTSLPHDSPDWGVWQMATATDIEVPCGLRGVPLCEMMFVFLHEQTLHHLFPSICHSRLHLLRPAVLRTAEQFGLKLKRPQNYISLYFGMLATIAGTSSLKQA